MLIECPEAISHIRIEEVINSQKENAVPGIDRGRVVRTPLTDCTNHMTREGEEGQEGIKKTAKGQWKRNQYIYIYPSILYKCGNAKNEHEKFRW